MAHPPAAVTPLRTSCGARARGGLAPFAQPGRRLVLCRQSSSALPSLPARAGPAGVLSRGIVLGGSAGERGRQKLKTEQGFPSCRAPQAEWRYNPFELARWPFGPFTRRGVEGHGTCAQVAQGTIVVEDRLRRASERGFAPLNTSRLLSAHGPVAPSTCHRKRRNRSTWGRCSARQCELHTHTLSE